MNAIQKITSWNKHAHLVHGYSTKQTGNLSFRSGNKESVIKSRTNMTTELGISWTDVISLPLTHSNNILSLPKHSHLVRDESGVYLNGGQTINNSHLAVHFDEQWQKGIDGIVTNMANIFPVIMSADCTVVALYDPQNNTIGMVHAGIIGAVNKIVNQAIRCMKNDYHCNPKDIEAVLFPSIRNCHYDLTKSGAWKVIEKNVISHYGEMNPVYASNYFDLQTMITGQLLQEGLNNENILDLKLCTICNDDTFFSNFSANTDEGKSKEGRFASIIGIKYENHKTS